MSKAGQADTDQPIYICGILEGDIDVANTVFIDKEGLVSANVTAERAIVQGVVVGSIRARQVEISTSGKVWGNVWAQTFHIEPGGFIRGQVITPLQTGHVLSACSPESPPALVAVSSLQPLPDDGLNHLLAELKAVAQETTTVDDLLASPQLLHIEEALARVVEAKNRTISQLQLELQAMQATLAEQEGLTATLSANLDSTGSERETALAQQNAELCDELERLRLTALQREQSLAELQVNHDEMAQLTVGYEKTIAELQCDREATRLENQRLQVELHEIRLALDAAQNEITHLSTDLIETKAQFQLLNNELTSSQASRANLIAATTDATKQLHSQLAEVTAERDQAAADLDAAQEQIAHLIDQLAQAHAAATDLAAERDSLQADLERIRNEHVIARAGRAETQVAVEQLTAELEAACAEIERLSSDHTAALSAVRVKRDDVSAELEAARQRMEQMSEQIEAARAEIERLEGDHTAALSAAQAEQDGVSAELEAARQRVGQLSADLDAARAEIERLGSDRAAALSAVRVERDDVSAELEAARQRMEQMTAELEAARAEIERLSSDHTAALSAVQVERDDVSAELEAARQRMEQMSARLDAERVDARTDIKRLTTDLDDAHHRLEQTVTERDTFQAECEKAQAAAARLTADLEDVRHQIAQLDDQLAEREAEIARLQADYKIGQDQIGQQRQEHTAYCLTCHAHRPIKEARELVMPDGRRAVKGHCIVCGASLLSLVSSD